MPMDVRMPDGTIIKNVPEGVSQEQLSAQYSAHTGSAAPPTATQSAWASMPGRVFQGMGDQLVGGLQLAAHAGQAIGNALPMLSGDDPSAGDAQTIDKAVTNREQGYTAAKQAAGVNGVDVARVVGNIASPTNFLGGGGIAAARGLPMLAKAGIGALTGAASGATQPIADTTSQPYWDQKGKQTAIGAAAGLAMPVLAKVASSIVAPVATPAAQKLMSMGIPLTPGMTFGGAVKSAEDKLSSVPLLGSMIRNGQANSNQGFNRAVAQDALKPIGQTLPSSVAPGREMTDFVHGKISDAYDNLLPKLTGQLDQQLQGDINGVAQAAIGGGAKQSVVDRFANVIKTQVVDRNGPNGLTGDALKAAQQNLGNIGRKFSASRDADDQQLGDMILDAQGHFNDMLSRHNPGFAQDLKDVNTAFAQYARIRRAGGAIGSKDGVYSAPQYANAVKAGDSSAGKGNYARGVAYRQDVSDPANQVLPSTVPDSGTAGRIMLAAALGGHAALGSVNPAIAAPGLVGSMLYTKLGQRALGAYASPGAVRSGVGSFINRNGILGSPALASLLAQTGNNPGP